MTLLATPPLHAPPTPVSTGHLPDHGTVAAVLADAYQRHVDTTAGTVADYIPALATADPDAFGLALAGVDGHVTAVGHAYETFSIQSVSKAFVYALACETHGHRAVRDLIGVNATGLGFSSVMAIELHDGHPMNPLVNAGALATTALMPGASPVARWLALQNGLAAFAGRPLALDIDVYESEAATNQRNRALAHLLASYGHLDADPEETLDLYTKQCSILVTARDLAVMGATLADGGVNPVTGQQVVHPAVARDTLAVLASAGMYEHSGEWLFEIGLPAKSGVSGAVLSVAPGKGALAAWSPPLDHVGTSVRARRATEHVTRPLGLDIFASAPCTPEAHR
ncbi:glutaminase A [Sanguibacter sp. HDW7]|uniref:glutaminase A n=1 Tax=Sanguibacter sp. HDW7 TaxID=2714931 RepID=UPI00140BF0B6|nr:glutaminase A [Sanguibacter sp. HDW7]QIK82531.1 glutaminase A [Sanguibacter sp. HDW7]